MRQYEYFLVKIFPTHRLRCIFEWPAVSTCSSLQGHRRAQRRRQHPHPHPLVVGYVLNGAKGPGGERAGRSCLPSTCRALCPGVGLPLLQARLAFSVWQKGLVSASQILPFLARFLQNLFSSISVSLSKPVILRLSE